MAHLYPTPPSPDRLRSDSDALLHNLALSTKNEVTIAELVHRRRRQADTKKQQAYKDMIEACTERLFQSQLLVDCLLDEYGHSIVALVPPSLSGKDPKGNESDDPIVVEGTIGTIDYPNAGLSIFTAAGRISVRYAEIILSPKPAYPEVRPTIALDFAN